MSNVLRNSFRGVRGSFRTWRRTMEQRDPKKIGILGAPQCRCTPLVLALCVALTGLVVLGGGACITGFMWSDNIARALGLSLVGLGSAMIISGIGLFIYDTRVRPLMPPIDASANYASQQQTIFTSTTNPVNNGNGQTISIITDVHTMPTTSGGYTKKPHSQGIAPPPYDTVLQEDGRHRLSKRGDYHKETSTSGNPRTHKSTAGSGRVTQGSESRTTSIV